MIFVGYLTMLPYELNIDISMANVFIHLAVFNRDNAMWRNKIRII
jgi:hypothetical protein